MRGIREADTTGLPDSIVKPMERGLDIEVHSVNERGKEGIVSVRQKDYPDAGRRARVAAILSLRSLANAASLRLPTDKVERVERQFVDFARDVPKDDITRPTLERLVGMTSSMGLTVEQIQKGLREINALAAPNRKDRSIG
jgi:hypothetical protein